MKDLYKLLELNSNASVQEIKNSYRKLAKKYHPDLNPGNKEYEQIFKEITAAYSILSDEEKRRKYDNGFYDDEYGLFNEDSISDDLLAAMKYAAQVEFISGMDKTLVGNMYKIGDYKKGKIK